MKQSISKKLLKNYILMFFLSTFLVLVAYFLMLLVNAGVSKKLVSRIYTAEALMQKDYRDIRVDEVLKNKGSVQVVTKDLEVINLGGASPLKSDKLTAKQWSDFLVNSKNKDNKYNYSIDYNEEKEFWLVVTFPVSLRVYFAIVTNGDMLSADLGRVILLTGGIVAVYFLMLIISTLIYSRISAASFIKPLKELCIRTKNLAKGNYEERAQLHLTAEFAELEENFNHLASELKTQRKLREESESLRKRMILDVSHDLKNPLASILGYSELCLESNALNEQEKRYLEIIHKNSLRANGLISDLFELSKMDSPDFKLNLEEVDICEFLRQKLSDAIPLFEEAQFPWDFDIPDCEIIMKIDTKQLDRVFFNLLTNSVKYNPAGTEIKVSLKKEDTRVFITVADDGVGINKELEKEIFHPFIRSDKSRNSETGGSGLGLAIVKKIVEAHGGSIELSTSEGQGCSFKMVFYI